MKKSINFLLVCMLALLLPSSSNGQVFFEGFENNSCQWGGGNNPFFLGCHADWISISGTPDNITVPVQPSEGSSAAHMYVKAPVNNCPGYLGESIALNYNFQAGVTYEISYDLQWGFSCQNLQAEWILTNNRGNMSGNSGNCADVIPFVMPSDDVVVNLTLNNPSNGWNTFNQTFTPTSNYNQIWFRPQLSGACTSSTNHLYLDAIQIDPCAGYTSEWQLTNSGFVWFECTSDPNPGQVLHWWNIFDTNGTPIPGNPAIFGWNASTATFSNNLQINTAYLVRHRTYNTCSSSWDETWNTVSLNGPPGRETWSTTIQSESKNIDIELAEAELATIKGIISKASEEQSELHNQPQLEYITKPSVNSINNYPNPFTNTTTIEFTLEIEQTVSLSVYDLRGRLIDVLLENEPRPAGQGQVSFDGSNLTEGIYFYTIESNGFKETKKMVLNK